MRIKYTAITTCKVELFYFDLFFKPFMGFHFVLVTVSIGVCPIKTTLVSPYCYSVTFAFCCQICQFRGVIGFAWGTKALYRSHRQRDIQSSIAFNFVLMYSALNIMLNWSVLSTNVLTNAMTSGDLYIFIDYLPSAWLSISNYLLILANKES